MDQTAWTAIVFGVIATVAMCVVAFTSHTAGIVGRQTARTREEERPDRAQRLRSVRELLDEQRTWFASLDVVTVLLAAIATGLLAAGLGAAAGSSGGLLAMLIVGAAYLLVAQALPVAVARSRPNVAGWVAGTLGNPLGRLFRPLALLIRTLAHGLDRLVPNAPDQPVIEGVEDEIRNYIATQEDAVIQPVERRMIDGVLHLEDIRVRELMVPRVDIVAVDRLTPTREILDTIVRAGHSRIPVYEESMDRVVGVLYAKDLLPFVFSGAEALPLVSILRPAYVVPETKRVNELLDDLRRERVHMAIVVDEYGGTAGVVTIEDILEEIVGEIQDEYDREVPLFDLTAPGELVADGRLAVEDAEEALGVRFEEGDYDTLGGFVHHHLGRVPEEGETFTAEGVEVEVMEVERTRVRRMRMRTVAGDEPGEGAADAVAVEASSSDGEESARD